MKNLLQEIKACTHCEPHLQLGANPVVSVHAKSKIVIIGQAPGTKVHQSGIPWDDQSGKRLREWMDISKEDFYNEELIGIMPMGFCYPGKGKSGDLPPRPECAPLWHGKIYEHLKEVKLTLLIGQYAQKYYLEGKARKNLTETVRNYKEYLPKYLPLPHPSPRNGIWLRKNEWFEREVLPELKERVSELL